MIDYLTVLSPGLLGASVAQAARELGVARHISIWARRPATRREVAQQPWCDQVFALTAEAVRAADMVVIAAPVDQIVLLAQSIAPDLKPGAIVTDVGSVKGSLCTAANAAIAPHAHFVGAHPMAGSEKTGWRNSQASLFQGRTCFVTPLPKTPRAAEKTVCQFWTGLGCQVVKLSPERHDEIVANISHLPQAIASTLCSALAKKEVSWRDLAGGGLRDTTRIAASDPELWRVIFSHNRQEVLCALADYKKEFSAFEQALRKKDFKALTEILAQGQVYRQKFKM